MSRIILSLFASVALAAVVSVNLAAALVAAPLAPWPQSPNVTSAALVDVSYGYGRRHHGVYRDHGAYRHRDAHDHHYGLHGRHHVYGRRYDSRGHRRPFGYFGRAGVYHR